MLLTDHREQKLDKMQTKIIKVISHSYLMFAGRNYILLDYSACGNDVQLHSQLNLMEKMIEKHFNVIRHTHYCGQRDLTISIDIA